MRLKLHTHKGLRVFRNNCGAAIIPGRQPVFYGVGGPTKPLDPGMGGSDHIGWQSVTITPGMVGKKVAVFVALENKAEGAKTEKERLARQENFLAQVADAGGLAGFVLDPSDVAEILAGRGCLKLAEYVKRW